MIQSGTGYGKAIIVSAPSGAGKTSIVNHLLESGLRLGFSVSATTRKPRGSEKNGVEYFFLDAVDFRKRVSEGQFVEWEEVYNGTMYGTLRSEVDRIWGSGGHLLFDVDVKGGISLKKVFADSALSLFIMPPSVAELEARLKNRGTDTPEVIAVRVGKAEEEIKLAGMFDTIVINDDLCTAQAEALKKVRDFLSGAE
ncbi:MAG: guanylate kinase [Bacteroidales bacterium]|jgi:guanylate kinase|nr:guanylate kinase [Bacteroidales bacterium]